MNYQHFALQKSFLVILYGIKIYVSNIILIKIIFPEPVWIKRGYVGKTQFYMCFVWGSKGGHTYYNKLPTS